MRCPRCGGENTENSTVCSQCNLKLKSACPRCKSLNRIGQAVCLRCNLKLIRFCPQCKAPNFPNIANCRKCGFQLLKPKPQPEISIKQIKKPETQFEQVQPKEIDHITEEIKETPASASADIKISQTGEDQKQAKAHEQIPQQGSETQTENNKPLQTFEKELSRNGAHNTIAKILKTSEQGLIIDISANDGAGKSTLLSTVTQSLNNENFIWLIGVCQSINQLLPYSFFQDMFKTLLGLPLFVSNIDESRIALNKILETSIGMTDPYISNILRRFLFNAFNDCSSNIDANREEIFNVIYQVLNAINEKGNMVIIIEDFEYIDNASLECIKFLLNKGFFDKKNFMLINHQPNIDLRSFFPLETLKNKILSMSLKSMTPEELNSSLLGMLNNQDILPPKIKNKIFHYSKDAPLYMEQVLWYLFQTGAIISTETAFKFNPQAENIELPSSLDELISLRIKLIGNSSPDAMRVIMSASLFGLKFIPAFVQMLAQIEEQQFNQLVQMLINNGIFAVIDKSSIRFKHGWIWKNVYEHFFTEEQIIDCGSRLVEFYEKYTTNTSNAVLARHAEEAQLAKESYIYYNLAAQESVYLGDPATFTDYQNKVLELMPETDLTDEQKELNKINVEEQIGRANYEYNPHLAIDYLSNAILQEEKNNNLVKVIDLTGYLARSCELAGNYSGVVECCDKALSLLDKVKYPLEIILLNYYKLESLFALGRLEEIIVLATNEVLPSLNKYITKNKSISGISISDLKNIEFESELTLAKAYVYQGNKLALELTENTAAKAQKENLPEYEMQALLLKALFITIQGHSKECSELLAYIKEKFANFAAPDKFKLYWYFIAIISNITGGNYQQTRELCKSAIVLANIYKEYNILSLLKLILGRCYEEAGQYNDAFQLYDEIVNYCSENKMATGALYSWYLAASNEVKVGNPDRAAEIAERAIEIAQKPNIANYLAEILMHEVIAKVRIIKNDFEGAQINIESAINIAENNDLTMCLIDLYIVFGQIYRKNASMGPSQAENNANISNRLFAKALTFAEQLENHYLISMVDREISELLTLCKQSGLKLENLY